MSLMFRSICCLLAWMFCWLGPILCWLVVIFWLFPSMACMLAATCPAVGFNPAWIISAVSRSSPSTEMVFATTRPSLSDTPSTLTLSPGISTVLDMYSFLKPRSPLLSLVLVSSVRTTVTFRPELLTSKVSPVREMIIPLTSVFSSLAPKTDPAGRKNIVIRHATIVFRYITEPPCQTLDLDSETGQRQALLTELPASRVDPVGLQRADERLSSLLPFMGVMVSPCERSCSKKSMSFYNGTWSTLLIGPDVGAS